MKIGIPKETADRETRVAITPTIVKQLTNKGFSISVEKGAGALSNFSDNDYSDAGAELVDRTAVYQCDIVTQINPPNKEDVAQMKKGGTLISLMFAATNPELLKNCIQQGINAFSLDAIPRTSLAQSMDVLSSQANLAGYKAVILGGAEMGKIFPMLMTSAGTIKPSTVVIFGAGVAGLQAIATAKRLGAVVYASDVRKSAAEQIESVGGRFIEVEGMDDFEDEAGYAKPLTPEFIQKVNDAVCEVASDADVIVTTARIFGRPAPITVPASAVSRFKSGSDVVEMNADVGGNCELTSPGEVIITENGVTIVGTTNLPGQLSATASMLYSNNLTTFVTSLVDDGKIVINPAR